MTQNEQHADETPKRAADDVAADMEHRLADLGHDIDDARHKVDAIDADPATGLAGDATTATEGPLSRGATPGAAHPRHDDDAD